MKEDVLEQSSTENKKDVKVDNTLQVESLLSSTKTVVTPTTDPTPSNIQHGTKEINTKGPAIAMLISKKQRDVNYVMNALKSIDVNMPQDNMTTPVLLFNEGNLKKEQKQSILSTTNRPIHFPIVDFQQFPEGFNPETEESNWKKRTKWGYQQMCRFWITKIWEHPVLDDYTSFMRFDTDSCFLRDISLTHSYLPGLPSDTIVYGANNIKKEESDYIQGLFDLAQDYVSANNITVKNPELWGLAKEENYFYNNFELSRIDFFRRPDVMAFQRAVTEREPFGVFRKRWGDGPVRLWTVAIFAEKSQLQAIQIRRAGYKHPCAWKNHEYISKLHNDLMNSTSTQR